VCSNYASWRLFYITIYHTEKRKLLNPKSEVAYSLKNFKYYYGKQGDSKNKQIAVILFKFIINEFFLLSNHVYLNLIRQMRNNRKI
jgi:hypothetical protein